MVVVVFEEEAEEPPSGYWKRRRGDGRKRCDASSKPSKCPERWSDCTFRSPPLTALFEEEDELDDDDDDDEEEEEEEEEEEAVEPTRVEAEEERSSRLSWHTYQTGRAKVKVLASSLASPIT